VSDRAQLSTTETKPPAEFSGPQRSLGLVTVVLAAACGLSVANLYYAQPLLALLATSFHTSQGTAAIIVTVTQIGYAIGLAFVLPLGDLIENRSLTSRVLVLTAAVLAGAALSPNFATFLALSVMIGITSVVAQILVPLAAHLAPPEERGRFVGRVMSGLLLGILLARTLSSLIAAAWGWRTVYFISAGLMLIMSAVLVWLLPRRRPDHSAGYPELMASVLELARTEPILRRRAICQSLMFAAFSAFWTAIAFELTDHHGMSQTGIGIFALVGAAGAAAAPLAGRLGDRGYGRIGLGTAFLLGTVAMLIADFGSHSLVLLALGAVLLDLAVQGHQVLSQREIYALRPDARARINTVYMTTVFIGGAIGSAVAGVLHDSFGWSGATLFAAILTALGFVVWYTGPKPAQVAARLAQQPV
jgi:predicted MFS family arabinose efflux permease